VTRGYRTYYGESGEDEISEVDLSGAFGYEETKNMDGKKTKKLDKTN
jgi:fructose-1,6-bisphosphatase